jgi:hypothetical protein
MIKRIFQDLDEAFIYSEVFEESIDIIPDDNNLFQKKTKEGILFQLSSAHGHTAFETAVRPCAGKLFNFYRKLVGKDNVYILTTSVKEYARLVCKLAEWEVDEDHIIAREDINNYIHELADDRNVLIDNLPFLENGIKCHMMGIGFNNYIKLPDYYGWNADDKIFEQSIKKTLNKLHLCDT